MAKQTNETNQRIIEQNHKTGEVEFSVDTRSLAAPEDRPVVDALTQLLQNVRQVLPKPPAAPQVPVNGNK